MQYLPMVKLVLRYGLVTFAVGLLFVVITSLINAVPNGLSEQVVVAIVASTIGFIGGLVATAVKDLFNPSDQDGN